MAIKLSPEARNKVIDFGKDFLRHKIMSGILMHPFLLHRNDAYLSDTAKRNQFSYCMAGFVAPEDLRTTPEAALAEEMRGVRFSCAYVDAWDPAYQASPFNTFFLGTDAGGAAAPEGVCLLSPQSHTVFRTADCKFAFIYLNFEKKAGSNDDLISYARETAKKLRGQKVAFVSVFAKYNCAEEHIRKTLQTISKFSDEVVGVGAKGTPVKISGTDVIGNLGDFIPKNGAEGSALYFRTLRLYKTRSYSIAKSYIPLYYDAAAGTISKIIPHDPASIPARRALGERITGLPEQFREMSLSQMLSVIGAQIPERYAGYADMPVDDMVTYPFYIRKKNTVVFFWKYDGMVHEMPEHNYRNGYTGFIRVKMVKYGRIFVVSNFPLPEDIPHVVVDSTYARHGDLCRAILDLYDLDFKVAITGSIGKTTCKEMTSAVLAKKYNTVKSPDNENMEVVIHSVFYEMNPRHNAYVQEVGGGQIGEASAFSRVIRPDVGVVTNIGTAHLRFSKTRDQLAINKIGVSDGIRNNGPLLVNFDNDKLQEADYTGKRIITYAIDNPNADYRAENIVEKGVEITFDIVHGGERFPAKLTLPGRHNVYNALVSFAVGELAGVPHADILAALEAFQPEGIRQHLESVGGYSLFVDCYNASYESMKSTVETLSKIETPGRRIAVLADMTGLDADSEKYHAELGRQISACEIDCVIFFGKDIRLAYENFKNPKVKAYYCTSAGETCETLRREMRRGDCILFKGSSAFRLEKDVIDEVFGTYYSQLGYKHLRIKNKVTDHVAYNYYYEFIAVTGVDSDTEKHFRIRRQLGSRPVIAVETEAFADLPMLESVEIPEGVVHLQKGAFRNCTALRELRLPDSLKFIDEACFAGCTSLAKVAFGKNIMHVGDRAFAGCPALAQVEMNGAQPYVSPTAFDSPVS